MYIYNKEKLELDENIQVVFVFYYKLIIVSIILTFLIMYKRIRKKNFK